MKNLLDALEPAKNATKVSQLQQLLPVGFLNVWLKCKFTMMKLNSFISLSFLKSIELREKDLFLFEAFCAALYTDLQRYSHLLSSE